MRFGGWTRGAFKYPAESSLRELIHTMVTDNDAASTFWAGSPSDSSTFFVSLSVSRPPFIRFFASLFFSRPSVVDVPSFFISFSTSLCAASSPSASSLTKIALFQRVPPLWGLAAAFESPIIRGRPLDPDRKPTHRSETRSANSWEQRGVQSLDFSLSISHCDGLLTSIVPASGHRIVLTKDRQRFRNRMALSGQVIRKFDCTYLLHLTRHFVGFELSAITLTGSTFGSF